MRTHLVAALATGLAALALGVSPAPAQSLAEVAKKEAARRTGVAAPAKTYTNADLSPNPGDPSRAGARETAAPPPVSAGTPAAPPGNASAAVASGETPPKVEATEEKLDEAYWRGHAAGFKARIEKAREAVAAVSKPPVGDEREQAKIAALLKKAQGTLDRALSQQELFQMQADAAKVPKDWIR